MELYLKNEIINDKEIYSDLVKLNEIYENITDTLQSHDEKLDSIIDNIDIIKLDVEKSKKDLELAQEYQNSAMWKKINLFGFLTVFTTLMSFNPVRIFSK